MAVTRPQPCQGFFQAWIGSVYTRATEQGAPFYFGFLVSLLPCLVVLLTLLYRGGSRRGVSALIGLFVVKRSSWLKHLCGAAVELSALHLIVPGCNNIAADMSRVAWLAVCRHHPSHCCIHVCLPPFSFLNHPSFGGGAVGLALCEMCGCRLINCQCCRLKCANTTPQALPVTVAAAHSATDSCTYFLLQHLLQSPHQQYHKSAHLFWADRGGRETSSPREKLPLHPGAGSTYCCAWESGMCCNHVVCIRSPCSVVACITRPSMYLLL